MIFCRKLFQSKKLCLTIMVLQSTSIVCQIFSEPLNMKIQDSLTLVFKRSYFCLSDWVPNQYCIATQRHLSPRKMEWNPQYEQSNKPTQTWSTEIQILIHNKNQSWAKIQLGEYGWHLVILIVMIKWANSL